MSRMALALIFASTSAPAEGQSLSDREAMERYPDDVLKPLAITRCPDNADPVQIVVCGARHTAEPPRLSTDGEVRLSGNPLPGEAPTGMAAMGAGACIRLCHQPLRIDIIGAVRTVGEVIERLMDDDD